MTITMTIDEVIEHCKRTVEFESKYIMKGRRGGGKVEYSKRYLEHKLVAEWLEDYKKLKSIDEDLRLKYCYEDLSEADNLGYLRGYNKAISEVDDLLSADLPISNVLHNINEFILCNNKGIDYDELDTEKECAECVDLYYLVIVHSVTNYVWMMVLWLIL